MKNIKLLLVDDEHEFVTTLAERLKMRELDPNVALDGEKALELVADEVPDVIVLDLKMPGIDGMEVLKQIKKKHPKTQVIMLTGHGSKKDEKEAKRLGAFGYFNKPLGIDELVTHIKSAYKVKIEDPLMAATFAEAGDFKTADEILHKKDK
jgi:DNA-binding response OmpR family regulator